MVTATICVLLGGLAAIVGVVWAFGALFAALFDDRPFHEEGEYD